MFSSRTHSPVLRSVNNAPVAMPSVATASRRPVYQRASVATPSLATASRIPVYQRASVASAPTATVQHARPSTSVADMASSLATETFHLRKSNHTHNEFRRSQSVPAKAQRTLDKGMIVVENRDSAVNIPMIGLISKLEELELNELRQEVRKANPGIKRPTTVAVLEGILKHIYYDPLQPVREEKLKEIEAVKAAARKAHRPQASQIPAMTITKPVQRDCYLVKGTHWGRGMLNVLGAEILSINIQLCIAFSELEMWDIVRPRVTEALAMAERGEEHLKVGIERDGRDCNGLKDGVSKEES